MAQMRSLYLALAAALLTVPVTFAAPVFESLYEVPHGWSHSRKAHDSELITLRIALQQENLEAFEQHLLDISTPSHPNYGQHMDGHEVKAMLKPAPHATNNVTKWLQDCNVAHVQEDDDWVNFVTTVGNANRMFETEFAYYRNHHKDVERIRTLSYSVPEHVARHINLVQPTTRFGNMERLGSTVQRMDKIEVTSASLTADTSVNCTYITPQCLFEKYNIHYKGDPKNGNKAGYASFLEEYARYSDLSLFESKVAPYAIGKNFSVIQFHGGLNDQHSTNDSGEANLDNQYVLGVGFPVPVTEFSTGGRGPIIPDLDQPIASEAENEPYLDYLQAIMKLPQDKLPQTISHSYGEDEQSVPKSYALSVCNLFAQLGARGVSVLFSSGDSGVGSACQSNDGKNTTEFQPQFPAACPWVTSVGGTTNFAPEEATYFSSGGFSRYWSRPIWQEIAVEKYLQKIGKKFDKYYNRNGRGFPDVSAQSYGYVVADQGGLYGFQGTSCASPTFAAVVTLLNSARISSHLPPLGFLNPWLYSIGFLGLNDIKDGGSTGCDGLARFHGAPNGSPVIPFASFNATEGWDPVTGLGTPDFGKLLALSTPWVQNQGGVQPK